MLPNLTFLALSLAAASQPANLQADAEPAIAAPDAGRPDEAVARLESLAWQRPDDADVLRRLGAAYAAAERYGDARDALERAQRIAPADHDIALARARVALWSGHPDDAARIADAVAAAEPANPELAELRRAISMARGAAPGAVLAVSHGRFHVELASRERTWTETAAAVALPVSRRWTLTGEAEHSDRGFATDTRLLGRVDARLGARGNAYLGVAITPDADFRERWSLRAGGEAALFARVTATLDARYSDFGSVETVAVEPGLRFALTPDLDLSTRVIALRDDLGTVRIGGSARVDWQGRPELRATLGGATYPDTEAGITRQVRAAFGGLAWSFDPAWTLRVVAEHERREETYTRSGLTVGLAWSPGR